MTNWIENISAVAGFITAVAALLAILEMKRQRRSTYKPDLVLLATPFSVEISENDVSFSNKAHSQRQQSADMNTSPQRNMNDKEPPLSIPAVNVGAGCCKALALEWEYDILEMIRVVKKEDLSNVWEIIYEKGKLTIDRQGGAYPSSFHNISNQNIVELEYVLPINGQVMPVKLTIPQAYVSLYSTLICLIRKQANPPGETNPLEILEELPQLKLNLKYKDLGDELISQKYSIVFSLYGGTFTIPPKDPTDNTVLKAVFGDINSTRI